MTVQKTHLQGFIYCTAGLKYNLVPLHKFVGICLTIKSQMWPELDFGGYPVLLHFKLNCHC